VYNQYVYIDLSTLSALVKYAMMTENALESCNGPVSQTVASVKALLQYKKIAIDPLPADVPLDNGRLVLVLSNKRDVYYTVTATACSCPANTYNPGQRCKHQRKHFPQEQVATVAESGSIRPDMRGFRLISPLPGEERAAKAASLSIIDCHDTSDKDAAYWSITEDKIMWPAEA
jgi:hypothetical protein